MILLGAVALSLALQAEEPPSWEIRAGDKAPMHYKPFLAAHIIKHIPAGTQSLNNMGCLGMPSPTRWNQMSAEEKKRARENIWCKTQYENQLGWVQYKYLQADNSE